MTVLDWFSRYGVSGELDQTLDVAFVLAAMRSALRQATPLICNADQGSPFTGLLLEAKVQISMDGRGRARDNVLTERLWRSIKDEEVYLHD